MEIIKNIKDMKLASLYAKSCGKKIGFVPTMGALHQGHMSLINKAKELSNFVVVSIFVNPIQFDEMEDFNKYPRNIEKDKKLLIDANVDVLFLPDEEELYPEGYSTYVEVPSLSNILCGKYRKGHFKGVCTIVCKLFNIVMPDIAIFGEKDYQQLIIIKKMVEDLNFDIKIISCPTVREKDGLAMSSRNTYLSKDERERAPIIYKSLTMAENLIKNGERDVANIKNKIKNMIEKEGGRLQYVEIVKSENLTPVDNINSEVVIAVAAFFGDTRLIDNIKVCG